MQSRLDHVHGLRGLAAVAVVIEHATLIAQASGASLFSGLVDAIDLGRFGVVLFFMISGLVIPFSFSGETPLRTFAIRRAFRLYPAYWLSIPVLALVGTASGHVHVEAMQVVANLTMFHGLLGYGDVGPGYWTLRAEALFYVFCAVLVWRKALNDVALIGAMVISGLSLSIWPTLLGFLSGQPRPVDQTPFMISMFLLGLLLHHAVINAKPLARRMAAIAVPLAIVAAVASSGVVHVTAAQLAFRPGHLALATGSALPIVVFVIVLWLKPKPGRAAMFLGTISYSLYLFQDVGLILLPQAISPGDAPLAYVAAVLGLSIALAAMIYRTVEAPMIELGRVIANGTWRRRPVPLQRQAHS
jgi:peptidoglycan/LPS O-acetylase OafA/YrhL